MSRDRLELERRLTAGESLELWAVYADLLMLSGDARDHQVGELLALELAGKLSAEEREKIVGAWFEEVPEFGSWDDVDLDEDGNYELPKTHPVPFLSVTKQLDLSWWGPFVVGAQLKQGGPLEYNDSGYSFPSYEGVEVGELLGALVRSPAGRFLRRLVLELGSERQRQVRLGSLPESIQVLHVGSLDAENAPWCSGGDLGGLAYQLPNLQSLTVWASGWACTLAPDAPYLSLKRLVLAINDPSEDQSNLLYPELFPALETLALSFWWGNYRGMPPEPSAGLHIQQQAGLEFLNREFPTLKHLSLDGFPNAVEYLLKSPLLPQLLSLELTGLSTQDLILIAEQDEAFLHIPDLQLGYDCDDKPLLDRLPWHIRVSLPGSLRFFPE